MAALSACQNGGQGLGNALMQGALAGLNEGAGGRPQSNPYLQQTTSGVPDRLTRGIPPVGPVQAPGCAGIEVVGYATGAPIANSGLRMHFMALRNTGEYEKIVSLRIVRAGPAETALAAPSYTIPAKQLKQFDVSLGEPPRSISVTKCL